MADFADADLRGSRFERADLSGAEFRDIDLTGARFQEIDMTGVVMRGVEMLNVSIYGELENVTVNGVSIGPLVEAELDRRYSSGPACGSSSTRSGSITCTPTVTSPS